MKSATEVLLDVMDGELLQGGQGTTPGSVWLRGLLGRRYRYSIIDTLWTGNNALGVVGRFEVIRAGFDTVWYSVSVLGRVDMWDSCGNWIMW